MERIYNFCCTILTMFPQPLIYVSIFVSLCWSIIFIYGRKTKVLSHISTVMKKISPETSTHFLTCILGLSKISIILNNPLYRKRRKNQLCHKASCFSIFIKGNNFNGFNKSNFNLQLQLFLTSIVLVTR